MRKFILFVVVAIVVGCSKDASSPSAPVPVMPEEKIDWAARADSSSKSLVVVFWNASRHYFNNNSDGDSSFQYWPQAHALDVLTDAYLRSGDAYWKNLMDSWLSGVKSGNDNKWKNNFFDDMEWIALSLERAYKATGEKNYLDASLELWDQICRGWNDYAGGGIAWKQTELYKKNACSNGPACILACRLYQDTSRDSLKTKAKAIFDWEKSHLLRNNLVLDHIDGRDNSITGWTFTYNQGTYIGSAVELYRITGDEQYLNDAMLTANAAMSSLSTNGILKLEGSSDSSESSDGHLFKGIFVRYLVELYKCDSLGEIPKKRYSSFIFSNAKALWSKKRTKPVLLLGPDWNVVPGNCVDLKSMVSGCTLIESASSISK